MNFHQVIDQRAAQAQDQLRRLAQRYQDEITVKVNWFIRSDAQKRRFQNARTITQERKTK